MPITASTSRIGGTTRTTSRHSLRLPAASRGTPSGLRNAQSTMYPMKAAISTSPGTTPARKRRAIDVWLTIPYTIIMIEGGISNPSVPEPVSVPMIMFSR